MSIRASEFILRGVKTGSFLLASVLVVLMWSLSFSQPAKAEGFLLPTVKCLLGTVIRGECKTSQQVSPVAPQPSETPPSQSPPQPPVQPAAPEEAPHSEPVGPVVLGEPLDISHHTPIEIKHVGAGIMSDSPNFGAQIAQGYVPYAGISSTRGSAEVKGESFAAMTPTENGWYIAGIAWYWWALGITVVTGIFLGKRYRSFKKSSGLSGVQ